MAISNFTELITQINATLTNFAAEVGSDYSTEVSTSNTVSFDRVQGGYRHGSWATPITGTITLSLTGAVEGGCAVVIWNGSANPTISGGTIQSLSGEITESGTYSIYFHYLNGRFNVNIFNVDGSGVVVPGNPPLAPSLGLTETTFTVGSPPLAPSLGLTETTF